MKQKDLVVLGLIVIVSAIFSLVISNYLFAAPSSRQQTVEVVGPISSTFTVPSNIYFNTNSIDPTQTIQVNLNANSTPFAKSTGN
jgi:hypothetical protein